VCSVARRPYISRSKWLHPGWAETIRNLLLGSIFDNHTVVVVAHLSWCEGDIRGANLLVSIHESGHWSGRQFTHFRDAIMLLGPLDNRAQFRHVQLNTTSSPLVRAASIDFRAGVVARVRITLISHHLGALHIRHIIPMFVALC
jgi:hypothetical protein